MNPAIDIASTGINTVMRVLADPTRRAVFEQIVEAGELTVGALTHRNDVSQPAISQHVRALKEAGLLGERRDGRLIHYRCEPRGLGPLIDWIGHYGAFWRERFANLRSGLKEMDDDEPGQEPSKVRHARHRRRGRGPAAA
jgi:DNA-binding transcriptional ArsR family regulator